MSRARNCLSGVLLIVGVLTLFNVQMALGCGEPYPDEKNVTATNVVLFAVVGLACLAGGFWLLRDNKSDGGRGNGGASE